jgi:DNA-binding CsgD family transcriptional regulator
LEQERLTAREAEVLRLLARGRTYAQAAAELGVSAHTLATHVKNAYRKLAVHNAAAAVMQAVRLGLIL